MTQPKRRTLSWRFDAPPERLWPLLSDTARLNEAAKLPKYQVEDIPEPDGRVRHVGRARVAGIALEWEEPPYEWVRDRFFRHARIFRNGPLRRFGPTVELKADGGG